MFPPAPHPTPRPLSLYGRQARINTLTLYSGRGRGELFQHNLSFSGLFFLGWWLRQLSFCIIWQHKTKQSPAGPNDQKLLNKAGRSSRWRVMKNRPQFIQPLKHQDPVRAIVKVTEICTALFFLFCFSPCVFLLGPVYLLILKSQGK